MTLPDDVQLDQVVARFFEKRREGQRSSIDDVLGGFADVARQPGFRAEVLRRIARQSGLGSSLAATQREGEPPGEPGSAGAPPSLAAAPPPDLDGYDIIDQIGRGGMGVVYEAYQQSTGRRVAIKFMLDSAAASEVTRRRFEREVEMVARLQHPHIVSVLDSGLHHGRYYYVMEYIDGLPLDEAVKAGECDVRTALQLMRRIAEAVDYAHQRGVLHRDLKPSNILVASQATKRPEGPPSVMRDPRSATLKVLDFGLAKAIVDAPDDSRKYTLSEPGQLMGTLGYMSPEQSRGEIDRISVRTDVYSLGAIAYELICGRLPLQVDGALPDVLLRIASEEPRRPSLHRLRLDADIDAILLKALEKEPDRRYATASELAEDIQRYLQQEPVQARSAGAWYQFCKFTRRNRRLAAVLLLVFLSLAAGAAGTVWQAVRATRERDNAEREAEKARIVSRFIQGAIETANPEEKMGRDYTVAQMLDSASEHIGGEFPEQPDIEAAIRHTIGRTYLGLALYAEAEGQLRLAADLFRNAYGPEHRETLDALGDLAYALHQDAKLEEAERLTREVVATSRRVFGEEDPATLTTQHNLAILLHDLGKTAEADDLYDDVLDTRRRTLGEDHADTLNSMNSLACRLRDNGKLPEAEAMCRSVLEAKRRTLGTDHPDTLVSHLTLAELLAEQNKLADAEAAYRDVLAAQARVLGPADRRITLTLNGLTTILQPQGRAHEVETLFDDLIARQRKELGDEHPTTLNSLNCLGYLYHHENKLHEAERLFREVAEARTSLLGEDHVDSLVSWNNVAAAVGDQGRHEEARELGRRIVEIRLRRFGPEHPDTLMSEYNLAATLKATGELAEAETLLREVLAAQRNALGEGHPDTLASLGALAEAVHMAGRLPDAEALWRESLEARKKVLGDGHPNLLPCLEHLARSLIEQDRFPEAEPLFRESLALRRRLYGSEHHDTVAMCYVVGRLLTKDGRHADAEPLLREAMLGAQALGGPEDLSLTATHYGMLLTELRRFEEAEPHVLGGYRQCEERFGPAGEITQQALARVIDLYDAWGKPDEAGRFRALQTPASSEPPPESPDGAPSEE